MTALTQDRKTDQFGTPDIVDPQLLSFPVAAATTIYGGAMVATDAAGNAVPASSSAALKIWGRCEKQVVNTVAAGFGAAGDLRVDVRQGVFFQKNGAGVDLIGAGDAGKLCYASDDNIVNLTDGSGLRPAAGKIFGLRLDGQVAVGLGMPSLYDVDDLLAPTNVVTYLRARNVVNGNVASLAAYTVAAGAATNDNVLGVAGDIVLLVAQTTPAQNGLYTIGTVAVGAASLTRIGAMPAGFVFAADQYEIAIAEGSVFAHSSWFNSAAGIIGTNSPAFFPEAVTITQALVAGTLTLTSVPVLSATKTGVSLTRSTPATSAATDGGYVLNGNPVPGALGTASVVIMASVLAGTINVADISTLHITVTNR
jgi:hypothetical protein